MSRARPSPPHRLFLSSRKGCAGQPMTLPTSQLLTPSSRRQRHKPFRQGSHCRRPPNLVGVVPKGRNSSLRVRSPFAVGTVSPHIHGDLITTSVAKTIMGSCSETLAQDRTRERAAVDAAPWEPP